MEHHPGVALLVVGNQDCPPCHQLREHVASVADAHGDAWAFVEADRDIVTRLGIEALPTLLVFREGVLLLRRAGSLPRSVLDGLVTKVHTLDMEPIHRNAA